MLGSLREILDTDAAEHIVTLAEAIDAWATSLSRQFVIVYGPHRPPPGITFTEASQFASEIHCQWCGKLIGYVYDKDVHLVLMWNSNTTLVAADPNFFDTLTKEIKRQHPCIDESRVGF